jgi:hypothetical protein
LTVPDDFLFSQLDGAPASPDSLRVAVLYPALDRAGIKREPRVSGFHLLRHTAGTLLHKQTGNLKLTQKQLGHAQMSITADLYVHPDEEEMRRARSDDFLPTCCPPGNPPEGADSLTGKTKMNQAHPRNYQKKGHLAVTWNFERVGCGGRI